MTPLLAPESTFFSGRGKGFNSFQGRGNSRPRGDDQNFDPDRYHPKLDRSNQKLDGNKINAKKDGIVMTCDYCGSFLHLWKKSRDIKEHRELRKFKTYANVEEFDKDEHEQEEDDANAYHDVEVTPESEAFFTDHLSDLGLTRPPNLPKSRSKKNPPRNPYTDTNITLYTS